MTAARTLLALSERALYRMLLEHLELRRERGGLTPCHLEEFSDRVRRIAWEGDRDA